MAIKIIKEKISKDDLRDIADEFFGEMIKSVVDIEKEIIAVGGELHVDANEALLSNGSKQENIWGINIYLDKPKSEWIEFSSLINIRPLANNRSMVIEASEIREKIIEIVNKLIN